MRPRLVLLDPGALLVPGPGMFLLPGPRLLLLGGALPVASSLRFAPGALLLQ